MLTKFDPGDRVEFTIIDQAGEWPRTGTIRSVTTPRTSTTRSDLRPAARGAAAGQGPSDRSDGPWPLSLTGP